MSGQDKIFNQVPGRSSWAGRDFDVQARNIFLAARPSQEIDLRVELKKILYGDEAQTGKGYQVILRQSIRGARGRAWNRNGGQYDESSTSDHTVSKFDWPKRDILVTCTKQKFVGMEYYTTVGEMNFASSQFFFEHFIDVQQDDDIIEIFTDDLGKPVVPVRYIKRYAVKDVERFRGNNGRVEFIRVIGSKTE